MFDLSPLQVTKVSVPEPVLASPAVPITDHYVITGAGEQGTATAYRGRPEGPEEVAPG